MDKLRNDQNGFSAVRMLLVLMVIALIGFVSFFLYEKQYKSATAGAGPTTTSTPKTTPTPPPTTQSGTITGTPSYPASGIPQDEEACAVSVGDSTKEYCDNIGEKQTTHTCSPGAEATCEPPHIVDFSIKVPAGDYYVYATAQKELPNYKAYYDEYSKCGNSVNCPASGHQQYIKVTVAANATVGKADPGDWYAH